MVKKYNFIGYVQLEGVKLYWLYTTLQTPKFIIRRDMTFPKFMVFQVREKLTTKNEEQITRMQIELEVKFSTENTMH